MGSYKKRTIPKNYKPYIPKEPTAAEVAHKQHAELVRKQMDIVMERHKKLFQKLKESGD